MEWKAIFFGLGEAKLTNENGEEYRLTAQEWAKGLAAKKADRRFKLQAEKGGK